TTVDTKPPSKGKNRTGIIVGVIVGLGLLSILTGVGIFIIRKRRKPYTDDEELLSMEIKPFTFTYSELKSATQDFNLSNKLGEGGFEPVYKVQTQMVQFSLKSSQVVDLLIKKLFSGSYHFTRLTGLWNFMRKRRICPSFGIFSVYAWIDQDVGYCQGMSDLCSPMIVLLEDEADSFFCFERLMRRLRGNFRSTGRSVGIEAQLTHLSSITQIIDPKLHQHLDKLGGGDYLCAIRMLMVQFRREFSFCDSLYLWEVMILIKSKVEVSNGKPKSMSQCGKYKRQNMRNGGKSTEGPLPISVFLVASVLKDKSSKFMTEARGLDDVVKILNDMSGNLDAKKTCSGAIKIHKKYLRKAKK
uniref:Rab-GAP TBC domain-containing protein n=1 Tax=Brassica oleracea var. oleracea TaxID=109376 RepID=A0A0D3EFI4_BRAOL